MLSLSHTTHSTLRRLVPALTLILSIASCSTTKYVPQIVEHTTHDTLYTSQLQHDSIYLHDSSTVQYHIGTIDTTVIKTLGISLRVDTVYKDRLKYSYQYKLLRDTTYINRVDSIPVIKEATVTKEVKYIPTWCKALAWIGAIMMALIILYLILKFTKR